MTGTELTGHDIARAVAADAEFCASADMVLTAVPGFNANTCRWYASETDMMPLATDTIFYPSVSSTTTFYVTSYNTLTDNESPERVPVTVVVLQGLYQEEFVEVCPTDIPYLWNDQLFYASGTYEQYIPAVDGCDSTYILHLTINQGYNLGDYAEICENELPYEWNGVVFQGTDVQTVTLSTSNGCDSVVTMRLVVLHSADVQEERTICSSELPYAWNGVLFEEEGVQQAVFPIPGGCDSTVTMTLTVHPSYRVDDTLELSINDLPYEWNGVVFAESGSQTVTLATAEGCDSVVTMHLFTPDAVNDVAIETAVRVWPNPSDGHFNISTSLANAGVKVYDVYGKLLMDKTIGDGNAVLDLSGYADGVYLLQVNDGTLVRRALKLVKR